MFLNVFALCRGHWEGQNEANCWNFVDLIGISESRISGHPRVILKGWNRPKKWSLAEFIFALFSWRFLMIMVMQTGQKGRFCWKTIGKVCKIENALWGIFKGLETCQNHRFSRFRFCLYYWRFFNISAFWGGQRRPEFDSHGDFKPKVNECRSTSSRRHFGCPRRCEMLEFQRAQNALFSLWKWRIWCFRGAQFEVLNCIFVEKPLDVCKSEAPVKPPEIFKAEARRTQFQNVEIPLLL